MAFSSDYGYTAKGERVFSFSLKNANGMEVRCINYGCRITHVLLPGAKKKPVDVVLGFDRLASYEADDTFQGTLVGRFAGRIAGARYEQGGKKILLTRSEGTSYEHGSMHRTVFEPEIVGENSVLFTADSRDKEDGFPGEVQVSVTYTLNDNNELSMDYRAVPKAATHINLTNHTYFNLGGPTSESVLNQALWLNSDAFLEIDDKMIPTGRILPVEGGAFDFRREKLIGRDRRAADPQLQLAGGYDHCFVLNKSLPDTLTMAAAVRDPASKRAMRVYTTQPAVVFYTANFLDGKTKGKGGRVMMPGGALCLETQHYPDTPNHPNFPTTLVMGREKYHHSTVYVFEW